MSSHTSRCLKIIQEQLQNRSRSHVLDLAKPCNDNLQFLARLNCKIYLADAYNHLNLIQHDQLRELIPKADVMIFDEAHQIADIASELADEYQDPVTGESYFQYFVSISP